MTRVTGWLVVSWVLGLGGGCKPVGPDFVTPGVALPAEFSQGGVKWRRQSAPPVEREWWRLYGDGTLTRLVEQALAANQTLAAAGARMRQARELSEATRSLYFPEVTLGVGAARSKTVGSMGVATIENQFSVPVDLRYEVDMWGKVRRQVESAGASAAAAEESLNALRLSVAGEVAQTYWALGAVDADRQLLARTLEIRKRALDLLAKRREAGTISALDLARAETEVATADSDRIRLDRDRLTLVNALAVLAGTTATGFNVPAQAGLPVPPKVPVTVPAELLRRRPDIRAAERRVAAANADIGVATAAFYPAIAIDANASLSANRLGNLAEASSLVWSLGANAATPITRRGMLKSQQRAAVAAHEAVSADYRQTVLESIREVEDALQGAVILERRQAAQDQAVTAARKTLDLSAKRFQAGLISFLEVVDAERTRLDAERAANAIRAERLTVSVSLMKALGGRW